MDPLSVFDDPNVFDVPSVSPSPNAGEPVVPLQPVPALQSLVQDQDLDLDQDDYTSYNPKYMIYLSDRHFKTPWSTCCHSSENKLVRSLRTRGMEVLPIRRKREYKDCLYDDNYHPEINVIYILLTDNKYYNDRIFPQKRAEIEREILLLLTGILGGSKVTCSSFMKTDDSFLLKQSMNVGVVNESIQLQDVNSESNGIERDELYGNSGSPIVLESKSWSHVKAGIKKYFAEIDKSSIISYDYFIHNSDLLLFAFKRFSLRLTRYDYKIEEDRTQEKSIQVRLILESNGLGTSLESKHSMSRTHHYTIEFYTMDKLQEFSDTKKLLDKYEEERKKDVFAQLRREYEINIPIMKKYWPDWKGEEKPIYNECLKYAKGIGISDQLKAWMEQDENDFNKHCHTFKSKTDVDVWFQKTLHVDLPPTV